jgi:hypothetical protein
MGRLKIFPQFSLYDVGKEMMINNNQIMKKACRLPTDHILHQLKHLKMLLDIMMYVIDKIKNLEENDINKSRTVPFTTKFLAIVNTASQVVNDEIVSSKHMI